MERAELIFIPSPMMGHIAQAIELAQTIITRFHHLSATILIINHPLDPIATTFAHTLDSSARFRIRFIHLPPADPAPTWSYETPGALLDLVINHHKPHVKDAIQSASGPLQIPIAAFVVDMFCTPMIDVANELGLPTYVFFTSGAAFLDLMLHFQSLTDELGRDLTALTRSCTELVIPSFANPVPTRVLPAVLVDEHKWLPRFLLYARRYREAKGIIVNTFSELESHAVGSFDGRTNTPPIFPVGPLLNRAQTNHDRQSEIMNWLDGQPASSVLFLCFGTMGGFHGEQVKEIANGLEMAGRRFIWSLRRPSPKGKTGFASEGIREVMDGEGEVRKKVMEMREKSRVAVRKNGSSYKNLERLVDELMESKGQNSIAQLYHG
ncbi:hypothetical protein RJ639_012594 [Escallonia herrerae]|uniref:Uncharacterized protein n=1 Tax=Escallonia herrerae TaxID=1293975 RepID=A0AA88VNG2_9ASTE|nr:hypothetical protein RJ639_012594 [Escallonia herrerae]